jgi:DNA polymerase
MTTGRHSYVPAYGPRDAKIAFVGEQPGRLEVAKRRPFVGPAGQELNECLNAAKLSRLECYFTNAIKDLDAPIKHYIDISGRNVKVSPEGQQYIGELKTELQSLNLNVVVAVGNIALYALTSKTGITKWRGSILESTLVPNLKVVPVLHPATIIPPKMVYLNKHLLVHDLQRVLEQSDSPTIAITDRKYLIRPSYWEVLSFLDDMILDGLQGTVIAFDIELHNMQVSCISFSS